MTRIKEPLIGTTEIPDYKSPPSRILRSLRQGYDNARSKVADKSQTVKSLQEKLRDTQESRDDWKIRAKAAEFELAKLKNEGEKKRKKRA
jgi:hypothetical protein